MKRLAGSIMKRGRPGLSTRLMVGLHLLKHKEGLSDEAVCARWVESPYFQYFSFAASSTSGTSCPSIDPR